ncbi:MAG: insulinase family protein [Terricaulis sp.]
MKHFLAGLAAAFLLAACATSSTEQAASEGALAVAPLEFHYRELPNGLRVYAMPDANTANVSVQVWYDVGSKDDPVNRSGFAHLFEHIMFKSTENMPAQFFDRLTEDVGGFNNASTYDDFTNYYEVVPANHLQRVLWAESERMGSLVVDEEAFSSERDVVKEELRQRVLASPYGPLFYLCLNQANFSVHPYGRPASVRSKTSTPQPLPMCVHFTRLIIGPITRCWSSPAISTRRSSMPGSINISARSRARTVRSRG